MSSGLQFEAAVAGLDQLFEAGNASVKSVMNVARALKDFNPLPGLALALGDNLDEDITDGTARLLVQHFLNLDTQLGGVLGPTLQSEVRSDAFRKKAKCYMTFVLKNQSIFRAMASALLPRLTAVIPSEYPAFPPVAPRDDVDSELSSVRTSHLGLQEYKKDYSAPPSAHALASLGGTSSSHRKQLKKSVYLSKPDDNFSVILDYIKAGYQGRPVPAYDIPDATILRRLIRDFSVHALPSVALLQPEFEEETRPALLFEMFRSVLHALTALYGLSVEDKLLMYVPHANDTCSDDELPGYERSDKYPEDTLRVGCTVHLRGQFLRLLDRAGRDLPVDANDVARYCQAVWHFLNQELICQGHTFNGVLKAFEVQFPDTVADWCQRSIPSHSTRAAPQRYSDRAPSRDGSAQGRIPRSAASQPKAATRHVTVQSPSPSPVRVRRASKRPAARSPSPIASPVLRPRKTQVSRTPIDSPDPVPAPKAKKEPLPTANYYKPEWGGDPDSTFVCFAESDYLRGKSDGPCEKGKKCTYSHDHVMIRAHNEQYLAKLSGSKAKRSRV